MRTLIAALLAAFLAGACSTTPDTTWASGLADMGQVRDGSLRVLYPRGTEWGEPLAEEVMQILRQGRAVARHDVGLDEGPFAVALVDTADAVGESYARSVFHDEDVAYSAFPLPLGPTEHVAAAWAKGDRLATAQGGPLARARHVAVFLEVHELAHVMLEHTLGPREFHLWMNEGLAEYVAVATGVRHFPADTRLFLRSRVKELVWLGGGKTIDFLRWSPSEGGEFHAAETLPDGTLLEYGWDDVRDPLEVRETIQAMQRVARASGDTLDAQRKERLWREWLGVLESEPADDEVLVDSGDWSKRWGVYAALFALFWEARQQTGEGGLAPMVAELRPLTVERYAVRDPGAIGEISSLARQPVLFATNDDISVALFTATGSDQWRELVRAYSVRRARSVILQLDHELAERVAGR